MKSFLGILKKDLKVANRNYYLIITIVVALIYSGINLFLVPKEFNPEPNTFEYVDETVKTMLVQNEVDIEVGKFQPSKEALIEKVKGDYASYGISLEMIEDEPELNIYLQGYEGEKTKAVLKLATEAVFSGVELEDNKYPVNYEIETLRPEYKQDKIPFYKFIVPLFILVEPTLVGLMLVAVLIFMEKDERTIMAFMSSPGRITHFLLSKVVIMWVLGLISATIVTLLVIGPNFNPWHLFLLITAGSLLGTSLGLLVASIFENISKAMIWLMAVIAVITLPMMCYVLPNFSPLWLRILPTYDLMFAIKEAIFPSGNTALIYSSFFTTLAEGLVLFMITIGIYRKTALAD